MISKEPLNEQEKRFLRALRLFLEADPRHEGKAKILDGFTPEQQRYMINVYHLALDDPQAAMFAHKIMPYISPILTPYFWVRELLERIFRHSKP
jgi:hypothetical protein